MDATIIAGALVLLTVSSIAPAPAITYQLPIVIAALLIMFFGESARTILKRNNADALLTKGFLILVLTMIAVLVLTLLDFIVPYFTSLLDEGNTNRISSSNQSNSSMSSNQSNSNEVNNTKNFSSNFKVLNST